MHVNDLSHIFLCSIRPKDAIKQNKIKHKVNAKTQADVNLMSCPSQQVENVQFFQQIMLCYVTDPPTS